ncbi:hypothetical protein BDU57DRAFT_580286 [Ampelomyces quisqualis]|uniref:MARVEL domain-containing protein n=1 Tax=Ampelomyces quisqualis TaxID=50730 RepID=A0A6A5QDR5_AMPQU|nr:hypothetical protein BDU57DRAFT_580286 [Ampelomyces quisqualis]
MSGISSQSETADRAMPELSRPPFTTLWAHTLQLMLAIVIIGLDVYGIRYIAYSALATCTIPVCIYLIAAHSYLKRLYSPYIASAYHVWMLMFWIIDLGLAANLVKLWTSPECDYNSEQGYPCVPLEKRAHKGVVLRSYNTYHGTLVAGALLAGFEV